MTLSPLLLWRLSFPLNQEMLKYIHQLPIRYPNHFTPDDLAKLNLAVVGDKVTNVRK